MCTDQVVRKCLEDEVGGVWVCFDGLLQEGQDEASTWTDLTAVHDAVEHAE